LEEREELLPPGSPSPHLALQIDKAMTGVPLEAMSPEENRLVIHEFIFHRVRF
jgi:hypothetical protein